jgi:hypothetical protein
MSSHLKYKHSESESASVTTKSDDCATTETSAGSQKSGGKAGWGRYACWAPLVIFIILFIILIIVCVCVGWGRDGYGGCNRSEMAGFAFLVFIVWVLILGYLCWSGNVAAAWFFLFLLPAIFFLWWISRYIGRFCCGN